MDTTYHELPTKFYQLASNILWKGKEYFFFCLGIVDKVDNPPFLVK